MENRQKLTVLKHHFASSWGLKSRTEYIDQDRYCYVEAGEEHDQTLLFLHGLGCSKQHWRGLLVLLKKRFHVIALDIPGFHHATKLKCGQYALSKLDAWLTSFITAKELDRYHLVGFSAGACLAALHASKAENQLLGSVMLLGFPNLYYPEENLHKNAFDYCKFKSVETKDQLLDLWNEQFYVPPALPDFMGKMFLREYSSNKPYFLNILSAFSESSPMIMARVHLITVPVLSIRGSHDQISGTEMLEYLQRTIKNIESQTVEKAGHLAYLERQQEIAEAISHFCHKNSESMPFEMESGIS